MRERDLYDVLSDAADASFAVNLQGQICFWNDAAEKLFLIPSALAAHQTCLGLLCNTCVGHETPRDCPVLQLARRGKPVPSFDRQVQTPIGNLWVTLFTLVATTSAGVRVVHIAHNVEVAKKLEQCAEQFVMQLSSVQRRYGVPFPPRQAFHLTERETRVLDLLAHGHGTAEIAAKLSISTATVRHHVQQILHKLNAHSRTEAVVRAVREHIT